MYFLSHFRAWSYFIEFLVGKFPIDLQSWTNAETVWEV